MARGSRLRQRIVQGLDRYGGNQATHHQLYEAMCKALEETTCARCGADCDEGRISLQAPGPRSSCHGVTMCMGCFDMLKSWWTDGAQ